MSALQSVVDDLSRKLANLQMSMQGSPSTQQASEHQNLPKSENLRRKRVKDLDEESLEDVRLTEEEIFHLFDEDIQNEAKTDSQFNSGDLSKAENQYQNLFEPETSNFLSLCMSSPEFQAALTATANSSMIQEKGKVGSMKFSQLEVC